MRSTNLLTYLLTLAKKLHREVLRGLESTHPPKEVMQNFLGVSYLLQGGQTPLIPVKYSPALVCVLCCE